MELNQNRKRATTLISASYLGIFPGQSFDSCREIHAYDPMLALVTLCWSTRGAARCELSW